MKEPSDLGQCCLPRTVCRKTGSVWYATWAVCFRLSSCIYRNVPKFSDRQVWANSADPDQTAPQSDQGLHCLQFPLHLLDALL